MEAEEINEIGFEEMLGDKNLLVIEWAEKIAKVIKDNSKRAKVIWINMYHKDENTRSIEHGEYNENPSN